MLTRLPGRLAQYLAAALLLVAACDSEPLQGWPDPTVFPQPPQSDGCRVSEGLAKKHVTVPLGVGIEGDVDDKLLPFGRTITAFNVRQGRNGELVSRTGTRTLGTGLLGTTDTLPVPAWGLGTLGDCLVSLSASGLDHPVNMYSPTATQWATDATNGLRLTGLRGPIVATPSRVTGAGRYPDVAYGSGYYFVTWVDATIAAVPVIYQAAIDATSGKKVFERSVSEGLAAIYRSGVRVVNGYAVFVRDTTANDIAFDAWLISNLDAGPTTTTFATTTGASIGTNQFDVVVKNATTISVAYLDNIPKVLGVDFVPSTSTATGWTLNDSAAATVASEMALNWVQDFGGSGKQALITASGAQGVRVQWDIPAAGATRQAASTYVIDAAPGTVFNVVGHTRSSAATGEFSVLYDTGDIKAGARTAGVISTFTYYLGLSLRSKTWLQGTDYCVIGEFLSSAQPTRYVLRVPTGSAFAFSPPPLATFQVRQGLTTGPGGPTAAVVSPSAGTWVSATTVQIRTSGNPVGYGPLGTGVEMVTISFKSTSDTTTGPAREAIGSLFVPGGVLAQFDGSTFAEAGFAYYPETPAAPALAVGGSLTPSSTYYWKFVYAYVDALGRTWRSAPSLVRSAVLGAADTKATFAIPTLRLTGRASNTIEVYRGGANDSVTFQRVGTVANNIAVPTVTFADTVADTTQASGEFLYTNGGVLANDALPGFTAICFAGNRAYGISADDTSVIWPSNLMVDGQGLRFSEQNKITVRDTHGGFASVAAQPNGNVVALKGDAAYIISGDGPDAAGRGGFSVTLVSSDVGTRNPRSVVETSQGVEFVSTSTKTGVYRIGTDLSPAYIGGPVQAYVSKTIVGAVMIPAMNEVRFYASDGNVLVRNIVTNLWSVDPLGYAITAATAYSGGAAWATSTGVWVDFTTSYADNGASFTCTIASPWCQLGGLRGYERMYRIHGVGVTAGAHTLAVGLAFDFDDTLVVNQSVVPGALWDWEMRYSTKRSAVRVTMSWVSDTGSSAGAKATALVFEYGIKAGMKPGATSKRTA